jgi:hypothetical protein
MNGNNAVMDDDENRQKSIESALASLQPLRDLAKNWDIDIASWYVGCFVQLSRVTDECLFLDAMGLHRERQKRLDSPLARSLSDPQPRRLFA